MPGDTMGIVMDYGCGHLLSSSGIVIESMVRMVSPRLTANGACAPYPWPHSVSSMTQ